MFGVAEPLVWRQDDQALTISIPEALQDERGRPCEHAWAVKIPMQPKAVIVQKGFAAPVTLGIFGICDRVVYTLDGSEPMLGSTAYTAPVIPPAGANTLFKARCVRGSKLIGPTACAEIRTSPPVPPKPDVYFDTLEPVSFRTGWQAPGVRAWRNTNCHGQPLKVSGTVFPRGVGMHAPGEAVFGLKAEYRRLVCRVGIDDAAAERGSAVVKVFLDNRLLCETPLLAGAAGLWNIDAKLEGGTANYVVRVVVEDNGDGIDGDNVDLVDAGFVVDGKTYGQEELERK